MKRFGKLDIDKLEEISKRIDPHNIESSLL